MPSCFSHVQLFVTLWTVAHQAPLSIRFSRQECWVGCHVHLQGIFPTQGSSWCLLCFLHWKVGSLPLGPPEKPRCRFLRCIQQGSLKGFWNKSPVFNAHLTCRHHTKVHYLTYCSLQLHNISDKKMYYWLLREAVNIDHFSDPSPLPIQPSVPQGFANAS